MVGRPRSRGSSVVDGGAPQCAPYAAMMVLTVRRGMVARPDHRYPSEDRSSSPLRRKASRILKTTRATASEASAVSLSAFAATYAAPATSTTSGIASRAKTNSSVTWTALWISPSFTVLGVFQAERSAGQRLGQKCLSDSFEHSNSVFVAGSDNSPRTHYYVAAIRVATFRYDNRAEKSALAVSLHLIEEQLPYRCRRVPILSELNSHHRVRLAFLLKLAAHSPACGDGFRQDTQESESPETTKVKAINREGMDSRGIL